MDRRYFLQGCGSFFLGGTLAGCQQTDRPLIEVYLLRRTIPIQLLRRFRKDAEQADLKQRLMLKIQTKDSLPALYAQLQLWAQKEAKQTASRQKSNSQTSGSPKNKSDKASDSLHLRLLSLGDYWMFQAIQNQLIQPLPNQISGWDRVPEPWRSLGRRNLQGQLDAQGQYWGAPYRWGATVLVYRKDKLRSLDFTLRDWSDLWRPELYQRLSLLNQPREVIGLALKSLGKSYNEIAPTSVPDLTQKLTQLHQQTRYYSSQNYIQPLLLGDTWVAMAWSTDALAAIAQEPNLGMVFPQSGSALWADMWVQAQQLDRQTAQPQKLERETLWLRQWIDYWWSSEVASDLSQFTTAISTIPVSADSPERLRSRIEKRLADSGQENLDTYLQRSEPILPLPPESLRAYQNLWSTTRSS